jgi:hypothetical protein
MANSKCVVIVAETLSPGLAANGASVIAMTLGQRVPKLVGPDVKSSDGLIHAGLVVIPVPVLTAPPAQVATIHAAASGTGGMVAVGFTALAQSCRTYDEYTEKMSATGDGDLEYLATGIFGPKRIVNKLAGGLPLLR